MDGASRQHKNVSKHSRGAHVYWQVALDHLGKARSFGSMVWVPALSMLGSVTSRH